MQQILLPVCISVPLTHDEKARVTFLCLQTAGVRLKLVSSDSHTYLQTPLLHCVNWTSMKQILPGNGENFLLSADDYRQMRGQTGRYLWSRL